jgi:hypothetical protein
MCAAGCHVNVDFLSSRGTIFMRTRIFSDEIAALVGKKVVHANYRAIAKIEILGFCVPELASCSYVTGLKDRLT